MLLAPVSPYHQRGGMKPSAAPAAHSPCNFMPFESMGGGSPRAQLHNCTQGLMEPSPMSFGASTPLHSPHHFVPFVSMGGEFTPSAGCLQPPTGATRYGRQGSMVPLPVTSGATRPSPSSAHPFLPTRSSPTHPLPTMGGSAASAACRALERSHQHFASTMSKCPGFADANPWVMETINTVALELQCWYQRHSIRRYLARQTRRCLAATTLQCWKRRIWLSRWFAQQAEQHQRRLRLRSQCCGASAYAVLVWGNRQPSQTLTDKTSDPKVLRHPFQDCSLPLPQRRRAQQNNHHRHCPGQRHWPRAPNSGGGPLCMPLCFWATQTAVAASGLFVGDGRLNLTPYLPPQSAASHIQLAYRSYVRRVSRLNNPTIAMLFACISFRILCSCTLSIVLSNRHTNSTSTGQERSSM
jgi:hypothetical protein